MSDERARPTPPSLYIVLSQSEAWVNLELLKHHAQQHGFSFLWYCIWFESTLSECSSSCVGFPVVLAADQTEKVCPVFASLHDKRYQHEWQVDNIMASTGCCCLLCRCRMMRWQRSTVSPELG